MFLRRTRDLVVSELCVPRCGIVDLLGKFSSFGEASQFFRNQGGCCGWKGKGLSSAWDNGVGLFLNQLTNLVEKIPQMSCQWCCLVVDFSELLILSPNKGVSLMKPERRSAKLLEQKWLITQLFLWSNLLSQRNTKLSCLLQRQVRRLLSKTKHGVCSDLWSRSYLILGSCQPLCAFCGQKWLKQISVWEKHAPKMLPRRIWIAKIENLCLAKS